MDDADARERKIAIIEHVARYSQSRPDVFENVMTVTGAKVPVLKFKFVPAQLDVDMCVNSTLGVNNTALLRTYGLVDDRFLKLGFMVKRWASVCNVNDASKGYMSSYAVIVMVLHYLQHTTPPVLPFLQELGSAACPKVPLVVQSHDCYFFEDLANLATVWPGPRNTSSLGALLVGFFRYFTEEFDFGRAVVCVRRPGELLKTDKGAELGAGWSDRVLAIEDPFELDHNLTKGVQGQAFRFIVESLRRARLHFGLPPSDPLRLTLLPGSIAAPGADAPSLDFLFNPEVLTGGQAAPITNGCHICGKIGHLMAACPSRPAAAPRAPERKCFHCGLSGHIAAQCPAESGPPRRSGGRAPRGARSGRFA